NMTLPPGDLKIRRGTIGGRGTVERSIASAASAPASLGLRVAASVGEWSPLDGTPQPTTHMSLRVAPSLTYFMTSPDPSGSPWAGDTAAVRTSAVPRCLLVISTGASEAAATGMSHLHSARTAFAMTECQPRSKRCFGAEG